MEIEVIIAIVVYIGLVLFVLWDALIRFRSLWWVPVPVLATMLLGPISLAFWLPLRPPACRNVGNKWQAPVIGAAILVMFTIAGWYQAMKIERDFATQGKSEMLDVVALFVIPLGPYGAMVSSTLLGALLAAPFLAPLYFYFFRKDDNREWENRVSDDSSNKNGHHK